MKRIVFFLVAVCLASFIYAQSNSIPAYQDAIRGLFQKFSDALQQTDSKWIWTAASAGDIASQLESANEILRKCK
jgi:3-methyladenine DNA glycosylase/8-oxoguanine DNA glycosylase